MLSAAQFAARPAYDDRGAPAAVAAGAPSLIQRDGLEAGRNLDMSDSGNERLRTVGTDRSETDAADEESMGGDPPCWAHLFDEDSGLDAPDVDPSGPGGVDAPPGAGERPGQV